MPHLIGSNLGIDIQFSEQAAMALSHHRKFAASVRDAR
jgi:hypothetical protein